MVIGGFPFTGHQSSFSSFYRGTGVGVGVPASVVAGTGGRIRGFFGGTFVTAGAEESVVVVAGGVEAVAGVLGEGGVTRGGMVRRGTSRGIGGRAASVVVASAGVVVGTGRRGGTLGRRTGGVSVAPGVPSVAGGGVAGVTGLILAGGVVSGNEGGV